MSHEPGRVTLWLVRELQWDLDRGDTLASLAARIGVPRSTLSRFMAGKATLTLPTVDRIVAGLGLGPNRWRGWGLARPDEAWHERF